MHTLHSSSITKLLHIAPAALQSPHSRHHRHRHHRRKTFSFNHVVHPVANQERNYQTPSPQPSPHKRTPLVDAVLHRGLQTHEAPFHVPGHKRGSTVPPSLRTILSTAMQYDLTELDGLDYLSSPEGPILEAQELAAKAWGAEKTWFLVNGTTVGIHAAIIATCSSSKDTLILARNAHQSAFNAAALAGCHVEYAMPTTACGLAHNITPTALEDAFQRAKLRGLHPKAAFVVSPTYFGVVSDIEGLLQVCRRHDAMLVVDEAHGAHLHFLPAITKEESQFTSTSALDLGADVVIQSTHKLLGALTQGAMLHLSKSNFTSSSTSSSSSSSLGVKEDLIAKISRSLSILQTSSPSYLIMASLDAARAQVQDPEAVEIPHAAATAIHSWFLNHANNTNNTTVSGCSSAIQLRLLTTDVLNDEKACMDPWRFTVLIEQNNNYDTTSTATATATTATSLLTGWDTAALLERECGVVAELATKNSIVFAIGMGTTMQHAEALIKGLEWLLDNFSHSVDGATEEGEQNIAKQSNTSALTSSSSTDNDISNTATTTNELVLLPEIVLTPREALSAAKTESVPCTTAAAVGRISAEMLSPYPPGVPVVCPGERISHAVLDTLRDVVKKGGKVVGAADGSLKTIRVILEEEKDIN
jgi:arginine decarboxylase